MNVFDLFPEDNNLAKQLTKKVKEDAWHGGDSAWSSEHDQWAKESSNDFTPVDSTSPIHGDVEEGSTVSYVVSYFDTKTGDRGESVVSALTRDDAADKIVELMHERGYDITVTAIRPELKSVDEDFSNSPVTNAITRRILSQRLDLLKQYGPELVGAAVDNVADYVGDVEEIGSSDVSAWVNQVERMLKENPPEAFSEGWSDAIVAQRTGRPRTPYSVYIKGKKWKDFENEDHAEAVANKLRAKFNAEGRDPSVITIAPTDYDKGMDEAYSKTPANLEVLRDLAQQWQDGDDGAYDAISALGWNIADDRKGVYIIKQSDMSGRSKIYFPELTAEAETDYSKRRAQPKKEMELGEAGSPAQQAAIAIAMKKDHKKPKQVKESYWTKLQNERSTKLNSLVNELNESIKDVK